MASPAEMAAHFERLAGVFEHSITWEDDVWKVDPFDVTEVHLDARKKFLRLLTEVTSGKTGAGQSRILLFHGQSGAGKTHLIRALRTYAHSMEAGYFGYAQMTPDVGHYADYFLRRLVNSLEKPYNPVDLKRNESALMRLSDRLVMNADALPVKMYEDLRDASLEPEELAELISELADEIVAAPEFAELELDINIVRALLYLQRNDPRIDGRVRQYLYGRQLNEFSQRAVAALDRNEGQDRAFEIIECLGRLMQSVEGASLVFCIDQVEDLRFFDDAEERFQKAVRDLIQIANRVPSAIIIISVLGDFYEQVRNYLPQSFIDRVEKSGPVLLSETRSAQEAQLIIDKRIAHLSKMVDGHAPKYDALDLFGQEFFGELAGLSTRRLLEHVEARCRRAGGIDEDDVASRAHEFEEKDPARKIKDLWDRFTLEFEAEIPSDEDELIHILAAALQLGLQEADGEIQAQLAPVDWTDDLAAIDLQVRGVSGGDCAHRLFVCNKGSQGGGLKRQIERVLQSTSGKSAIIVRASDFPPNSRSVTGQLLRRFLASGGRRIVIPIYEWERMITLQEFAGRFRREAGFDDWMKMARPLGDLPSIGQLLRLEPTYTAIAPTQLPPHFPDADAGPLASVSNVVPFIPVVDSVPRPVGPDCDSRRDVEARGPDDADEIKVAVGGDPRSGGPDAGVLPDLDAQPVIPAGLAELVGLDKDMAGTGREGQARPGDGDKDTSQDDFAARERGEADDCEPGEAGGPEPSAEVGPSSGEDDKDRFEIGALIGRPGSVDLSTNILRRHAAMLGGSGSGKTTLALSVIEELLQRGIPAVLIDRKGDLCSYANPEAWRGIDSGDDPRAEALKKLRSSVDVAVYTPGRISGRPIGITLLPTGIAELPEHEQQLLANVSAAALGEMLHLRNSGTHQRLGGILAVALKLLGARSVSEVTLADLIYMLENEDEELGELASRMDSTGKIRRDLIAQLDSLRYRNWALFEGGGEPLRMEALLGLGRYARPGKTRLSVIYTGFLGDNENILFWVAQFLSEALRFCQRNPAEGLQALVMFDEADLYIPASAKPATSEPLQSLLKRARSAGIGVMLATQSPGDLDYKSRDQITSWFIGRVREDTALRKLRAAFAAESGIDPARVLPNQTVGEFHLIQEGNASSMRSRRSLINAEQVPFDRIEQLAAETKGHEEGQLRLKLD